MKIFVDDFRSAPGGWVLARTFERALILIRASHEDGDLNAVSLDHDIGACESCTKANTHIGDMSTYDTTFFNWCPHAKCGVDIVQWMIDNHIWPSERPTVHSHNPKGKDLMEALIEEHFPMEESFRDKLVKRLKSVQQCFRLKAGETSRCRDLNEKDPSKWCHICAMQAAAEEIE